VGAGNLFTLEGHPRSLVNQEYLIVSSTHEVVMHGYESGEAASSLRMEDSIRIEAIESRQPFRCEETTEKPVIHGPQTAIVVGKKGEEIWTDEHGRVKVQFHWDREGKEDEKSSCWIRVAQIWAGKGWGGIALPRIGQEVIVEFLGGDPDRPIVTGRVYNGDNKVPYALSDNQTQSGIKSRSTKKGSAKNFNELRFEDKKGVEEIFIQAERDQNILIKNNHMETVRNTSDHSVQAGRRTTIGAADHYHVKADRNEKVDGKQSLTVDGDQHEKVGSNHALEAGNEIHLKGGMKVIIEAGMQLSLKGAGGFIDIGPAGVTIQGTLVNINSGGSAGSGSGSSPTAPDDAEEVEEG
jgi:type VI secretion system secreted protein VgrG